MDMDDMYDIMVDDYLTGDAQHYHFSTKKNLAKRFWINPANFTEEELLLLKNNKDDQQSSRD